MSRTVWPWFLVGGGAAAIAYLGLRRAPHADAAEGSSGEPRDPALRNASLSYRPIGRTGEPYPAWVRALRGKSGVYIVRERQRDGSNPVVYVGQSQTGRLYQTLTRHFQTWHRSAESKKFHAGRYTRHPGHDPGLTYNRARVTVAVRVLSAERAMDEEARLIARLRPRDNLIGQPADVADDEVIPF